MIHVLMVESEPRNLIGAKTHLEKDGDLSLETARNMDEGLKKLKNAHFSIIISAYELQGQDGATFLRAAKRISPDTPMILYSMKCREERLITFMMMETKNIGADFLLVRGETDEIRFNQLSEHIRSEYEKKSRYDQAGHRNNVLLAIKNIGLISTENKGIDVAISEICSAMVESGAYGHAFIVLTSENGRVTGYAQSGINNDFGIFATNLEKGELPGCIQNALKDTGIIASKDPHVSCPECPLSSSYGGLGAMTLALRHGEKVYGTISVSLESDLIVDESEQDLFEEAVRGVSSVINRVYGDRERIRTRKQVSAQQQLGKKLSEAETLEEVIRCVVESSVSASEMDCGALYLVDDTSGGLSLAASRGLSDGFTRRFSYYPPESEMTATIFAKKTIYSWFGSVELHMLGITDEADEGLKAVALVPIIYRDRVIGSLHVASHMREDVPQVCRDAFETIAAQAANAIIRIHAEKINPSIELLREVNRLTRSIREAPALAEKVCRRIASGPGFTGAMAAILDSNHLILSYHYGGDSIYKETISGLENGVIPHDAKESLSSGETIEEVNDDGNVVFTGMKAIGEHRYMILSVSAGKRYEPDPKTHEIFDEIKEELAYAFGAWIIRKDLESTSEKLREQDELLSVEQNLNEKSESLMSSLFCATGTDGVLIRANTLFSTTTGKKPDEIRGLGFMEFFPGEYRDGIKKHFMHISEKGAGDHEVSFSVPLITASGEELPVEWTCTVVRSHSGTPAQILCSGRDLSERKKAEEQYNEVLARYTGTISSVEEGIIVSDLHGTIQSINPAAEMMTGWSAGDAAGASVCDVIDLTDEHSGEHVALPDDEKKEGLLRSKNGKIWQAEVTNNQVKDGRGVIIGYLGVIRDLSGKHEAFEAKNRLKAIFETAGPVILTDLTGKIELWNSDAETATGRSPEDMTGANISVCFPPDKRKDLEKILSNVSKSKKTNPFRSYLLSDNGRETPVMVRGAPLFDQREKPRGAAISFLNLSGEIIEKKRAEELEKKYSLLRNAARATYGQAEHEEIADSVCELLVSPGWFEHAWILLGERERIIEREAAGRILDEKMESKTPCTSRALEFNGPVVTRPGSAICEDCLLSKVHENLGAITIQLSFKGESYGVLGVSGREEMIDDNENKNLIYEISEMVSHAFSSIASGKNLDRITMQASAQHKLAERLANATTIKKVVNAILDSAIKASSGSTGAVYLYEQDKESFLFYDALPEDNTLQSLEGIPSDSEPGQALLSGEPLLIKNIPGSGSQLLNGVCLLCIAIPLVHMNRLIGSLIIGLDSDVQPDEQLVKMLESIASFGALSIHRIRTGQCEPLREAAGEINRLLKTTDDPGQLPEMICMRLCETPGIIGASVSFGGDREVITKSCGEITSEATNADRIVVTRELSFSGKHHGSVTLYIDGEYASNPEITAEIEDICGDISFALHSAEKTSEKDGELVKLTGNLEELEIELQRLERAEGISDLLIAELNPDRSIRRINERLSSLREVTPEDIKEVRFEDLFTGEEDREDAVNCISALTDPVNGSGSGTFHALMHLPSSESRWIEWKCAAVDEDSGIICSGRDLTEAKEAEEKVHNLLAGYMGTLSAVDNGVIISDRTGRIFMINRAAELLTAWSAREAKGKILAEVLHPVDEQSGEPPESIGVETIECILRAEDGTEHFVEISRHEAPDDSGRLYGHVTVVRDITERRCADEDSLKLEAAIGAAGPVAITDMSGIITELNNEAGLPTGMNTGGWIGRDIRELFLPEISVDIDGLLLETGEEGRAISVETGIIGEGGETKWVRIRASPVRDMEGSITGIAIGFIDISGEVSGRNKTKMMERNLSLLKKVKDIAKSRTNREDLLDAVCNLFATGTEDVQAIGVLCSDGESTYATAGGTAENAVPMETGMEVPGCLAKALRFGNRIITSSPSPVCDECPFAGLHDGTDVIALRLEHGGRIFGVLAVSGEKGIWEDSIAQETFTDILEITSLALSRLESEEERISSSRESSSQKELAEWLAVINSPIKAADAIIKSVTGPLGMDCGMVYLYENNTKSFRCAAHTSSIADLHPPEEINSDSGPGQMIISGKTSCTGENEPDEETKNRIFGSYAEKLRSCASIPMIYKNSLIGTLITGSENLSAIDRSLCGTLESIASYGASSIHRIRIEQVRDLIMAGEEISRILRNRESPEDILNKACAILSNTNLISESSYSLEKRDDEPGTEGDERVPETIPRPGMLEFGLESGGISYGTISILTEDEYTGNPEIGEVLTIIVQDIADHLHTNTLITEMNEIIRDLKERSSELDSEKNRLKITGNIMASYLAEIDTGGKIRWINKSLEDAFGTATDDLSGRDFADVFEEGDNTCIIRDMIQNVANSESETEKGEFNSSFRPEDGTIHTVEWTCSAIKDRSGVISGLLCSGRDLSDRIQADERLSLLASRLNGTLESLDDAVILTDEKGIIVSMNASAEELAGVSSQGGFGEQCDDVLKLTDESGREKIDLTFDLENTPGIITGTDGNKHFIRATARTVSRDNGTISARVIVIRDVTPERETGENVKKMEAMLKSSGEPIAEISVDGIITGWNEFAAEETGYGAGEIMGRYLSELVPEEIREEAEEEIQNALSGRMTDNHIDTIITHSDGTAVNVEITVSTLSGDEGAPEGASVRWRNITGEKIEKRKLHRINKILETVVAIQKISFGTGASPGTFCEECCKTLTGTSGVKTALISLTGIKEDEEICISPPGEYSSLIRDRLHSGEIPEFIEIAMEHPGVIDLEDIRTASKDEEINRIFRGKRVLAVRLEHEGDIFGYLFVSVMKTDMFPEDHDWFETVAGAISSGLSGVVSVHNAGTENGGAPGDLPELIPEPEEVHLPEQHPPIEELQEEISTLLSLIEKPVIVVGKSGEIVRVNSLMENLYPEITSGEVPDNIQELFPGYDSNITGCLSTVFSGEDSGLEVEAISDVNGDPVKYDLHFTISSGTNCLVVIKKIAEEPLEDLPDDLSDFEDAADDLFGELSEGTGAQKIPPVDECQADHTEDIISSILPVMRGYSAIVDHEGNILRANRELESLFEGLGMDDEIRTIDLITDQASGKTISDLIRLCMEDETTGAASGEMQIISPNGAYLPGDARVTGLAGGESFIVVAEYIKNQEEATAGEKTEQETEYPDVPGTAVTVIDDEGRVILINSRMKEITGVSMEWPGEDEHYIYELMDPSKSAIITEYIHMMGENPDIPPIIKDFQFADTNGNALECDIAISSNPETGRTILSFNDVSEYTRSIRELEEELEKMKDEAGIEKIEVVGIRCKDKFIYLNSAGLVFFGAKSLIELSHKPIIEYVLPAYREESQERTRMSYVDKKPTSFVYMEFIRDDGTIIHGETATVPLYYGVEPASLVVIKNTGKVESSEK